MRCFKRQAGDRHLPFSRNVMRSKHHVALSFISASMLFFVIFSVFVAALNHIISAALSIFL